MTKPRKVLVVDGSKVVRASVAKYLREHYEICEESNGESAWQTLVLDSGIAAVFASHHLGKLDGLGLAERMRENRLPRLNSMPFFMMVSDNFTDAERHFAADCGVTDIIPKKATHCAEMAETMQRLIAVIRAGKHAAKEAVPQFDATRTDIGTTDVLGHIGQLATAEHHDVPTTAPDILERPAIDELLLQLSASGSVAQTGILVFGLDAYGTLVSHYGSELARKVEAKFCTLLLRKIGPGDRLGRLQPGRVVIVAPQTSRPLCASFAQRVCKAFAAAEVSVRGTRVDMAVSAGLATLPDDGVALTGPELLQLAVGRLDTALRAGGNRVICGAAQEVDPACQEAFVRDLKKLMASVSPEAMSPCLGNVGVQLMPILTQLEQSFGFGLPLDDMSRRLWARARAERQVV